MKSLDGDLDQLFSPLPELTENKEEKKPKKFKKEKKIKEKNKLNENNLKKESKKRRLVPSTPICKFYLEGRCKNQSCTFLHEGLVQIIKKEKEICKFHLSGVCQKGESCTYSHDFSKYPCRYFHIDGECRDKNCKFSHEKINDEQRKELLKLYKPEEHKENITSVSIENPFSKSIFDK